MLDKQKTIDHDYKNVAKFATIEVSKEPEVESQFIVASNKEHSYTIAYSYGSARKVSLDKLQDPAEFRKLYEDCVQTVEWDYVKRYLDISPLHYKPTGLPTFNFLLVRHDPHTPFTYLKKAMNHRKMMKFGTANPLDRTKIIRYLEINPENNLLFSYVKTNAKGERNFVFDPSKISKSTFVHLINLASRHTLVGKVLLNVVTICY